MTGETIQPFELKGVSPDQTIRSYSLEELTADGPLLLNSYAFDFSPVCTTHMCDISEMNWMTFEEGLTVAGICMDGPYSHQRFMQEQRINFPLLCDISGDVLESLDLVYRDHDGFKMVPKRGIVLIDSNHTAQYQWIADDNWDDWTSEVLAGVRKVLDDWFSAT